MITKNHKPSAVEQRWHDSLRSMGSVISGRKPVHIHHCAGAAAKSNRIHIGQIFVLPLTPPEHDAVPEWGHYRKEREKSLFRLVCGKYRRLYGELPFGDDVMDAILSYTKGVSR